ncbi:MAG: SPOR domain-containing protein [Xanthomonadales bacterium]|nr:SPOR domain-containing protein [Xanthomonadales bacterium]
MLSRFLLIILIVINILVVAWFMAQPPATENIDTPQANTQPENLLTDGQSVIDLQLLSETDPNTEFGSICATIGPLESAAMVRRLRDRLSAYASRIRERQTEARVERGFWVYLPIADSRNAAIEYTNQLGSMGINDYFVVTSGEMQNAVSLGLYNNLPNAEMRQKQLQALGFNPQLGARREYETRYWLDYQLLDDVESPWKSISHSTADARRFQIQCWQEDSLPETSEDSMEVAIN